MVTSSPSESPSLQKNSRFNSRRGNMARLHLHTLVGDPFALATVSISILAWIIAFVSCIISDIEARFPNYAWWAIGYMLCVIIGITVVLASDTSHIYGVAVVGYLSAGLSFTSLAINSLIYDPLPAKEAAAAGFILLSMVIVVWMFYFGSTRQSGPRGYIDSFALHKEQQPSFRNSKPVSNNFGARPETTVSNNQPPQMYTSAQLSGFETSSPVSGYQSGPAGADNSAQPRLGSAPVAGSQTNVGGTSSIIGGDVSGEISQPTEYPYKAKAIYSYEANPDDANEISFSKHEILEVSDVSGRWWQAKKSTGETGIAPSNYLILL